jgi:hypothetical protein
MTTNNIRTAQAAFDEQNTIIAEQIKNIQKKLNDLNRDFNGNNWAFVGTLNHVSDLLAQANQHLH